jgi:hypothetical protein
MTSSESAAKIQKANDIEASADLLVSAVGGWSMRSESLYEEAAALRAEVAAEAIVAAAPRMGSLFAQVSDLLHLTPAKYVVVSESLIGGGTNWIGFTDDVRAACDAAERLVSSTVPCERIVARRA